MRRKLVLAAFILSSVWALGGSTPASAYCEVEMPDGSCTNSCTETAKAYNKVRAHTGNKLPTLDCPQ